MKAIDEALAILHRRRILHVNCWKLTWGDYAKMNGRFDANLRASFGYNQTAGNLGNAYKSPMDAESVSLTLNIPIVDWGVARGKINIAESQRDIVKNQVEQGIIDFRQVLPEYHEIQYATNQLQIAAKADTVAKNHIRSPGSLHDR